MKTIDEKLEAVRKGEATYGMILDDFVTISGIPNKFYSAEDPADRVKLWRAQRPRGCHCGECNSCDPLYKD